MPEHPTMQGVPPTAATTANEIRYFPEDRLPEGSVEDGSAKFWRIDGQGVRWFTVTPTTPVAGEIIHAVA